jgi:trans-2,3-dihydro-3-hydroxyanthranilate isomerase
VLGALGLGPGDGHPELPVQPVSCGIYHLMVPLRDGVALARARPSLARVSAITAETATMVLYAFVPDFDSGAVRARGFFEAPDRVLEDPATGSAAGPLCAYLHRHAGVDRLRIDQGVELGRPSRLDAAVERDRVRVGGECVILLEGELTL